MAANKKSDPSTTENIPADKNISIGGNVVDSVVIVGDNNKTFFQKVINIFKSDAETLEHRNRRILLGHVENAWIKGVLDASLHGAALLDLGIKQDPEAVTKYPWAIKKESTDETLPAGTSMLDIFDSIGMGRSLLILGAPGSGKTTMLLELARQLIARAREDVTYPIPMVFNLASWTEKLTLADWLAQELNNLYSVPRKTAPDWVKRDKLLLLLDGLDEVRQDSRAQCVEAINAFRKEYGLTSLAVCSRSQDYADLNTKLSFEGAIEVQPLTQEQIAEFFNRFGEEMAGIKQVLKKDNALREMVETPLFLSIMILTYRDKQDVDILVSQDMDPQRKHLFDNYIERMFERPHSKNSSFKKQDVLHWLAWLAQKMIAHNQVSYLLELMQPDWLVNKKFIWQYRTTLAVALGLIFSSCGGLIAIMISKSIEDLVQEIGVGLVGGWFFSSLISIVFLTFKSNIRTVDRVIWSWKNIRLRLFYNIIFGLGMTLVAGVIFILINQIFGLRIFLGKELLLGLWFGIISTFSMWYADGLQRSKIEQTLSAGQWILLSMWNFLFVFIIVGLLTGMSSFLIFGIGALVAGKSFWMNSGLIYGLTNGSISGLASGVILGGDTLIQHYTLRLVLSKNNFLPFRLIPFLDHCVDLIFLRRVGGGYIFVHRLLMEHFADMYVETPTSKGN